MALCAFALDPEILSRARAESPISALVIASRSLPTCYKDARLSLSMATVLSIQALTRLSLREASNGLGRTTETSAS